MSIRNHASQWLWLFSFVLLFFAPHASYAQYWCGQVLTPPDPGPPPQPPPCCECERNQGVVSPQCTGSPVFPYTGNYANSVLDLQLPTRGFPIALYRNYDSVRMIEGPYGADGPFGISWTSSLTGRLRETTYMFAAPSTYHTDVIIVMPNGRPYRFRQNTDGTFTPNPTSHYSLIKNGDSTYDLTLPQSRSKYHYGSNGQLMNETDDYGNSLSFTYNGNGSLYRVTDATGSGRYLEFGYGGDGRVNLVHDSGSPNRNVSYNYNAQGALTSVVDPASRQTTYDYFTGRFAPLLKQITDNWGRLITTITYDRLDRTATFTEAGETYTYGYSYQGNASSVSKTDSSGNVWSYTFTSNGLITGRVPPTGQGGGTISTVYNDDGTQQYSIDEAGVKTSYTYNSNGTVATILRDDGGSLTVRFDYSYDPNFPEKVISITPKNPSTNAVDPNWQAWKYDYYQVGSAAPGALFHVYRVQSDGVTLDTLSTYTYNSAGQVLSVTDASGGVTTYSYNPSTGDLASVTYPKNSDAGANPVYQYGRDSLGRVTSVTDPLNHVTSYSYDVVDRITSVTLPKPTPGSPLNFVTTYSYDNYDSLTGLVFNNQTDPNSKLTKQGFDQFGQLKQSIDALNKTTAFAYNKGLLSSITDANNNVTSYTYNGLRRLITTTFPDSTTEAYTYTPDGLFATRRDRKNQTITYNYDHLKRLTSKVYPNSTSITYSYTGQKLMSVSDTFSSETHSFTYDNSYRIASNTQGTRGTISYTYNPADRVATYSLAGGPTGTYGYFVDGSLKSIQWSPVGGEFDFNYTLSGQYGSITFPNGQHRDYTYDDQGRLTQIANLHPTAGDLGTFGYGYDSPLLGQRTSMTSNLGSTNYSYDSNYQLTQVNYPSPAPFNSEVDSWTYDSIGNRLTNTVNGVSANYSYYKNGSNPLNGQRLQSDATKTYTYDNNGNLTGDGTNTYAWDYENRLVSISGSVTATYSYDYLGRRASKTVNSVTTNYIYDGQNLIHESTGSAIDYVFGAGIDEPLAQNRSGAISYYDVDSLGSTTALDDPSGAAQNTYTFDAWGVLRNQTGSTPNSFGYTSREFAEANLYFYRARYYSPTIGRFVSEDPIRFSAGTNFYAYANNRPSKFTDPTGLYPCTDPFQYSICKVDCDKQEKNFLGCEIVVEYDVNGETLLLHCKCGDCPNKCKPCTPNPPVVHYTHPHGPCKGAHIHYYVVSGQNPENCKCDYRKEFICLDWL